MLTYQDFLQYSESDADKANFILLAINDHEGSQAFKDGKLAGQVYRQHDPELEAYERKVYDMQGNAHVDNVSPNHKLVSNFYYIFIDQLVQYELGNGISFDNEKIQEQLGTDFVYKIQDMLTYAANDGKAFAFYTGESIEPFCFACKIEGKEPYFVPIYDENDGSLKVGVRYWRLAPGKPLRATLYEIDGFTEFKEGTKDESGKTNLEVFTPKQRYKSNNMSNAIEGVYESGGDDYPALPIIEMDYINGVSALGKNYDTIHAYNMILSGYTNNVDWNLLYWVLTNCDGMDRVDDINFIADTLKTHVLHLQNGQTADPHQIQIQHEAREALLARLKQQLYTDFQAVDVQNISAGNTTATEINAAYNPLERKCDKIEKYISRTIQQLLVLMGYGKNEPFHFQRARERNESEAIQTAIMKAPYIGDEAVTKEILEISGKTDEFEKIQKQKAADALVRASLMQENVEQEVEKNAE